MNTTHFILILSLALAAPIAAAPAPGSATAPTPAPAAMPSGATKKLLRQISVMEKVVDQVLVDSANLQVTTRNPTHGVYLEEFGVLLTVETSITHGEWNNWPFGNVKVVDGNVIVMGDSEDHPEVPEPPEPPEVGDSEAALEEARAAQQADRERAKSDKDYKEYAEKYRVLAEKQRDWVAKQAVDQEKRYEAGKEELLDVLLDYGETLTALRDDQSVAVAAFIDDVDFMEDRPGTRIVFKIRMKDLRAASGGTLSADDLRRRVSTEEY